MSGWARRGGQGTAEKSKEEGAAARARATAAAGLGPEWRPERRSGRRYKASAARGGRGQGAIHRSCTWTAPAPGKACPRVGRAAGPCQPALLQGPATHARARRPSRPCGWLLARHGTCRLDREHYVGSQGRRSRNCSRERRTVSRRSPGRRGACEFGGADGAGAAEIGGANGTVDDGVGEGYLVEHLPQSSNRISTGQMVLLH